MTGKKYWLLALNVIPSLNVCQTYMMGEKLNDLSASYFELKNPIIIQMLISVEGRLSPSFQSDSYLISDLNLMTVPNNSVLYFREVELDEPIVFDYNNAISEYKIRLAGLVGIPSQSLKSSVSSEMRRV